MNVLVAGGAGFIGSHLCLRLVKEGHNVTVMDNLVTGCAVNLDKCYELANDNGTHFSFVQLDISNGPKPRSPKFDLILHLASPASPKWYGKDPIGTIKANVFGAFNLLDLAKEHDAKIFFASTSEIYGDPNVHPQTESYWGNVNTVGPRSNYDESKRCAETIFYEYHQQYGVDIKIARIFNTYGPNMALDDGRVVSNFIVNALEGTNLVINGNGSQTRSFMYVDDLVNGIVKLCESKENTPVNLGNPVEFTIIELAELILKKTNSNSRISFAAPVKDEPYIRRPDITKAENVLGWKPDILLSEGLDRSIPYFESELQKGRDFRLNSVLKLHERKC